jgi:uncharacterized protein (TIGR02271 family)
MLDSQNTSMDAQFVEGTAVFDAAGEKVGTVSDQSTQGSYLVVQKGWLFHKDVYVPLSAIQRNDADGVYLNLYKDDLSDQQYEYPPDTVGGYSDTTTAAGGYMGSTAGTAAGAAMDTTTTTGYTSTVGTAGTMNTAGTADTVTTDQDIRVPVMEEELSVGKREEEIGRVHLHKDVVEEQQTVTEPVTREEVHVERVPVQGQYTDVGPDAFVEKDIDVPVVGEELVVGKRAVVSEEVRLRKEAVTEQQQISDTVRKERVTVEGVDGVQGADAQTAYDTTTAYGTASSTQAAYGTSTATQTPYQDTQTES